MAIILRDFYQMMKPTYKLNLIAGKDGMERSFSWMYLAEDMNNMRFLKANEIVVTTGLSSRTQKDWLKELVTGLIVKDSPCLIVNTGKYLFDEDITSEIRELCDRHAFPLFTMPWEMHLSELFQSCSNLIFEASRKSEQLRSVLRRIISEKHLSADMADVLENCNYSSDDYYCLCALAFEHSDTAVSYAIDQMQRSISSFLYRESLFAFSYQHRFLILGHHKDLDHLHTQLLELLDLFHPRTFYAGISTASNQITDLEMLYRQACASQIMAEASRIPYHCFDDFGYYRLFFAIEDKKILYDYYRTYIGEVEDYDKLHQSNYLETLESYLRNNGQLSVIAKEMNCHRNTVYYRTNKLKEWLHLDMGNGDDVFHFQLSLNIRKYLRIFEKKDMDT